MIYQTRKILNGNGEIVGELSLPDGTPEDIWAIKLQEYLGGNMPEVPVPIYAKDVIFDNSENGSVSIQTQSTNFPFAAKVLSNGSKIFRRVHGISAVVQNTTNNIDFVVPYANCKISGLQILNGKLGDKVTFQVLDTPEGAITGIPYRVLNTFGIDVFVEPNSALYPSKYDADLFAGLTLRLVYDPADESLPRTIYVNFDLHEVINV